MTDKMSPLQRHFCMSKIKSNDTKPELLVRKYLWKMGFRYRTHVKSLPGTPDIVLSKIRTVIFVNGCFWHGHIEGQCYRPSKANTQFWSNKIRTNKQRDLKNYRNLKAQNWNVLVIWECQLTKQRRGTTLSALSLKLSKILLESIH